MAKTKCVLNKIIETLITTFNICYVTSQTQNRNVKIIKINVKTRMLLFVLSKKYLNGINTKFQAKFS